MELSRFCREAAAETDREGAAVEAEKAGDLDRREISQAGIAADAVRKPLLDGVFRPGELLAENLKMSRTPVREALRRLQAEGVLEYRKGQGTFLKR